MIVRYTVMAVTGLNDPTKTLKSVDKDLVFWDTFADAKAEVVARAMALLEYLESSERYYRVRSISSDERYEVWFEYGPGSSDLSLPFKTAIDVCKCRLATVQAQEADL